MVPGVGMLRPPIPVVPTVWETPPMSDLVFRLRARIDVLNDRLEEAEAKAERWRHRALGDRKWRSRRYAQLCNGCGEPWETNTAGCRICYWRHHKRLKKLEAS